MNHTDTPFPRISPWWRPICNAAACGMVTWLTGCVGLPPKAAAARLYSPSEKLAPGPQQGLDVDGEVGYCAEVYSSKVFGGGTKAERGALLKKDALANIAKACGGGDDSYYLVKDIDLLFSGGGSSVTYYGAGGLVASRCDGSSRMIYFKCKGAGNKPAAGAKSK